MICSRCVKSYVYDNYINQQSRWAMTEFILDCLWVLSQCVIGFAIIMLVIIGANTVKNTWKDLKHRMEERANEKWKKD